MDKKDEISLVMLLNKLQRAGDFVELRKVSYDEVDRTLKGTPKDVLNLIAGIVKNMCRKLNVPEDETNEYVSRIRGERKMGYFFENMEKMDIQEERRLRKEAQENAEKKINEAQKNAEKKIKEAQENAEKKIKEAQENAEKKINEAQENAEKKINEAEKKINDAEKEAQQKAEEIFIETLQELSLERSEVKDKFRRRFVLDEEQAEEKMKLYWKESN